MKKRILSLALILNFTIFIAISAQGPGFTTSSQQEFGSSSSGLRAFGGGSGTAEDPWLLATAEHLDNLRLYLGTSHTDKHFLQIADINLDEAPWNQGAGWMPIGTSANAFHGKFDGNGHAINGLMINRPGTSNVGLWGYVGVDGHLQNVSLFDADVTGGNYVVGTLAGYNRGTISGAHATGSVHGGYRVGGLVGENNPGTVENASADVTVTANDGRIGGLVGFNVNGTVTGSHATGSVTAGWYVGGLVGRNMGGTISHSYATGNINGSNSVGGLVGDTEGGSISNSYATGAASGGGAVGGLVGYHWQTTVNNCYSVGEVQGSSWGVGGLIGYRFGGQVIQSFWNTETSGQNNSEGGTGKTTGEMVEEPTYGAWDFQSTWGIINGQSYPYLQWQGTAGSHNYPWQTHTLIFEVKNTAGEPLAMAIITVGDIENDPGDYVFEIPPGTHSYLISKYCYISSEGEQELHEDMLVEVVLDNIPGDANGDGTVNVLDALAIVSYFLGSDPGPFCFLNADANGDGVINVQDVIATVSVFLR